MLSCEGRDGAGGRGKVLVVRWVGSKVRKRRGKIAGQASQQLRGKGEETGMGGAIFAGPASDERKNYLFKGKGRPRGELFFSRSKIREGRRSCESTMQ